MIQVHADYNRDGRLDTGQRDYSVRQTGIGAIVAPNLDADTRTLPADAAVATGLILDAARATKSAADSELLEFRVSLTTFPLPAGSRVELAVQNFTGAEVRLYNSRRSRLAPRSGSTQTFDVTLSARSTTFYFEVTSFAASPANTLVSGLGIAARVLDAQGAELGSDSGNIRLAPLILAGDVSVAQRVYMAEVPGNLPSVRDLRAAAEAIGLPFVPIPEGQNSGDSWIQDQFQLAYTQTPGLTERVIFHLPRMRSDSLTRPGQANLSTFVDRHFPSRDLGIFLDFWTRTIEVIDTRSNTVAFPLREAEHLQFQIERGYRLRRWIMETLQAFDTASFDQQNPAIQNFFDLRINIGTLQRLVVAALDRARAAATTDGARDFFRQERDALRTAVSEFITAVPATSTTVTFSSPSLSAEVDQIPSATFESELDAKLSSLNYGGNIEVSPALQDAPFGKIVVGSKSFEDSRDMDPDLLTFLEDQGVQPVVRVHTAWLDVGHVDEIMTFVPSGTYGSTGFCILRASPGIGMRILRAARDLFDEGINWALRGTFDPGNAAGYYPRHTDRGAHPVTHMLRGKFWLHSHQAGPAAPQPLEPPRIYKALVRHWRNTLSPVSYTPGPGEDRHYHASLSVFEFLHYENVTNRIVEEVLLAERPVVPDAISGGSVPPASPTADEMVEGTFNAGLVGDGLDRDRKRAFREFLDGARLDAALREDFRDVPIIGLPVLFDRLDDWVNDTTIAYLPDMINLQQSGNHVFVPRPYGPRMCMDDAITVLNEVMGTLDGSFRRNLNARALQTRGLNQTWHWQDGGTDGASRLSANEIATYFRDGFPRGTGDDEIARRIRTHARNGNRFAGNWVKPGWQKIFIPEDKVDLFEAYTQLVMERLGLTVHWVDSWSYHVHSGGIHCGTNCLRRVGESARSAWWNRDQAAANAASS